MYYVTIAIETFNASLKELIGNMHDINMLQSMKVLPLGPVLVDELLVVLPP